MSDTAEPLTIDLSIIERELWDEAVAIYNREFTRNHKIKSKATSGCLIRSETDSLDELFKVAQTTCAMLSGPGSESARTRAIHAALKEVRHYAPICDIFTQGAPSAVSVCWATLRIVIELTTQALNFQHQVTANIFSIARILPNIKKHLRFIIDHSLSKDTVTRVYAVLLNYLVRVVRVCRGRSWSSRIKKIKMGLEGIYREFVELANVLQAQCQAETLLAQSEANANLQAGQRYLSEEQNKLRVCVEALRDTNTSQVTAQHKEAQGRQLLEWLEKDLKPHNASPVADKGTCDWFHGHEVCLAWEQSLCATVLWVCGASGSGKSALSSFILDHGTRKDKLVVRAAVASAGTPMLTTSLVISLLSAILRNTSIKAPQHYDKIFAVLSPLQALGSSTAVKTSARALLAGLRQVLALAPPSLILVDGLDQLEEIAGSPPDTYADELLTILGDAATLPNLEIITFSRPRPWIKRKMEEASTLHITHQITNHDIAIMVERQADCFPSLQVVKPSILTAVKDKGSGDFMYATLLLKQLRGASSVGAMRRILEKIPNGLEALMKDLADQRLNQLDRDNQELRSRMLRLVFGAKEPLSIKQVNHALVCDLLEESNPEDEEWFDPHTFIVHLCEPFLTIHEDRVYFQHESAREYVANHLVRRDEANAFLLNICLTKLTELKYMQLEYCAHLLENNLFAPEFMPVQVRTAEVSGPGLYDHATLHWHEYALQLQYLSAELWGKLRIFLFQICFVVWAEHLFVLLGRGGLDPHLQRMVAFALWFRSSPDTSKPDLPVDQLFVKPYQDVCTKLHDSNMRPELQYLPLIRITSYLNNAGRTREDFETSLEVARRVVEGFTRYLGPNNRNTLSARMMFYSGLMALRRPDEALVGYQDVLRIQKRVLDENDIGLYVTMQWIGNCHRLLADFDQSRAILEESLEGFKRIQGEHSKGVLFVSLGLANTIDLSGSFLEASNEYSHVYDSWVPLNGISNLFASNIMTALGGVLQKLGQYDRAEEYLFDAFATRVRLLGIQNDTTVDSALHLAVLYRQEGQRENAHAFLEHIEDSKSFEVSFERRCQLIHLRALLAFDAGEYPKPRDSLMELVSTSTGDHRDCNNRELLCVRRTLADAARDHGDEDLVPSLFADLVESTQADLLEDSSSGTSSSVATETSSVLGGAVLVESLHQLKVAEEALRLVLDKKPSEGQRLLEHEHLQWVRPKDFWILGGGPKIDTDVVKYRLPRLMDPQQAWCEQHKPRIDAIAWLQEFLYSCNYGDGCRCPPQA